MAEKSVYAPQQRDDRFVYKRLKDPDDLRLDHDVTILPPKKYLMPQRETLLKFSSQGQFESVLETEDAILFGVHPYDVAAIMQMDQFFRQDNPDVHYLSKREKTAIVACDVQNPSANVFAGSMGTATATKGYDILLTLVGEEYVVEAATDKGEKLLAVAGKLPEADPVSLGRREQVWQDAEKLLNRHTLRCKPQQLPELLKKSYNSPVWEEQSKTCFSCGSCVMVCPSCFCFDVQDDVEWNLQNGNRKRRWDSCLLREFALVAGEHNFRKQRDERYRHRFYRKGAHLPQRCGFVACVGCGRCATACTAEIANPVNVYNLLLEEQNASSLHM
jgi:ferredoxin